MASRFSLSHVSAGFVAILVGYTSSAAIIFQAASAAGADAAQISSWLWALGLGMGASSIGLSLYFRAPVLTAWSTPGAALLVTALQGVPMSEAIAAFLFCSALITLCGVFGWFDALTRHIPYPLAAAMLAGVLLRFGLDLFIAMQAQTLLVIAMLGCFLLVRLWSARYAIPLTLLGGLLLAAALGDLRLDGLVLELAAPVFTAPSFAITSLIGIGLPLFIVTMASQNIPGLAVLRANGYHTPVSPLIGWTGATGLVLAPFGGFAFNLAAITAAICMNPEAERDPQRRYLAVLWAGGFYLLTGLFGATVVGLFSALPTALIQAIAGLALLSTLGGSLAGAMAEEKQRDAALVTFLVTASGLSLGGIGSAFWGLLLGLLAMRLKPAH